MHARRNFLCRSNLTKFSSSVCYNISEVMPLTVIWADTLFAVNFSMDFLALYITGRWLHSPIRGRRLALAALLGALFATLSAVFDRDVTLIRFIWAGAFVGCASAICAIAFDGRLLRSTVTFAAVNLGLGGLIGAMSEGLRRLGVGGSGDTLNPPGLAALALVAAVVSLAYGRAAPRKRREVEARIRAGGREVRLTLLVDSGNLLCEPIEGLPVVIVRPRAELPELELTGAGLENRRLRLIPASGVTGERLICGFVPDSIEISGREVAAVVAPVEGDYGGCEGIAPEVLC